MKMMVFKSQTVAVGFVVSCVVAAVFVTCSAAPTSSKKDVEKDETIIRHKDINTGNQKVLPSVETRNASAKQESEAKPKPVKTQPKVVVNPVPGQLETILHAVNHMEPQDAGSNPDISRQDIPSDFLQEQEEEEEELPENGIYKRWLNSQTDPRLQNFLEENDYQQRSNSESKMADDSLYSPEVTEYLARVSEADRTIRELVNNGMISPREAAMYRDAIEMEYGTPLSSIEGFETQPVVEVPEGSFDGESSNDIYEGPRVYQAIPSQDYSADYSELSSADQFLPREEEERENEEEEEEGDYVSSKEQEEELLREILGLMSLQENEQSMRPSPENKIQNLNPAPASGPISFQPDSTDIAVEKELESLPVKASASKTPEAKGTEEELQLEEIRNRKTKQDNRTKSATKELKAANK